MLVYGLCLYAVGVRGKGWFVLCVAAVTVLGAIVVDAQTGAGAILAAIPLLSGAIVRARRSSRTELAQQARRLEGERALLTERQRIARELHDIVAHHMSVIAIQAEAGPRKVANPPPELAESFADIRASALSGLDELRRLLGVMRSSGADTAPQPGLAELDGLLDSARSGGVRVTSSVSGTARALPQGIDLSAYRILQEALSNAMRHAPGSAVRVELAYAPSALVIKVRNDACAAQDGDSGRGGRRSRPYRHAGTGGHARWPAGGRPHGGRRFPGHRGPAGYRGPRGRRAMTVRVVIADDQGMVRSGFTTLLNSEPDIEVVGEAVNGQEAVTRAIQLRPDVILMDVRMPVMDGLQATRQITAMDGGPRVLVLTTFDLDDYVYQALRWGASGFLLKDASARELAEAVRVVAAGDALLSPSVTRRLIAEFARMGAPRGPSRKTLKDLTERETEVLALVARGLSNAEIAGRLVLAEQTVKTHVSRILMKLGLRDRTQAVVLAYETGLVQPGG